MAWTTGSVAAHILSTVDGITSGISGALPSICANKLYVVGNYVGVSLDASGFDDQYADAVINLTMADCLRRLALAGVDATSISLGDFSMSKGKGSNLDAQADAYDERARDSMALLGRKITNYQTFYG